MMATTTNSSTRLKAVVEPFIRDLIPAGDVVNIIGVASIWCAVCKS
jgi:capsular polysaccharide biosynthesis protein